MYIHKEKFHMIDDDVFIISLSTGIAAQLLILRHRSYRETGNPYFIRNHKLHECGLIYARAPENDSPKLAKTF